VTAIREATLADVNLLAPLFDAYRQFYERPTNLELSRTFLADRLEHGDSVVFIAEENGTGLGFVQLYPLFSSTARHPRRLWLLNDLFVAPGARGRGIGRELMNRARRLAEETGACGLELVTGRTNANAQTLYESLGYHRDDEFLRYELML
jgi:GNAT superfamily N-acetyltransferase